LGFKPGEQRAFTHGETVTLVVRVRNVGKEAVKFSYLRQFSPNELLPTVTDGEGKPVSIEALVIDIRPQWSELTLPPGQESDLHELKLDLRPASESGRKSDLTLYGAGKFYFQHERMNGMFSPEQIKIDPKLEKLATGKLELEMKPAWIAKELEELNAKILGLKTEREELKTFLSHEHPSVRKLDAEVEALEEQRKSLIPKIGDHKQKGR
jgi:hypothetical protein